MCWNQIPTELETLQIGARGGGGARRVGGGGGSRGGRRAGGQYIPVEPVEPVEYEYNGADVILGRELHSSDDEPMINDVDEPIVEAEEPRNIFGAIFKAVRNLFYKN